MKKILFVLLAGLLVTGCLQEEREKEKAVLDVRLEHSYPLWQYEILSEGAIDAIKALPSIDKVEEYHIGNLVGDEPLVVIGMKIDSTPRVIAGDRLLRVNIKEGRSFEDSDEGENVALLGREAWQGVDIGSTIIFPGTEERLRVIGRFSTGTKEGDRAIVLPLKTAERLLAENGVVTLISLTLDSTDNLGGVEEEVRGAFEACPIMLEEDEINIV